MPQAAEMAAAARALCLMLAMLGSWAAVHAQPLRRTNVTLGSSLVLSTNATAASWSSPSGRFSLGFYPVPGGYKIGLWLATMPNRTIVWTALRDEPPVTDGNLTLSADGWLLWKGADGGEKPIPGPSSPGSYASMLDSGSFTIYNSTGGVVWSTFDAPTDTILGGQTLLSDEELVSSSSDLNQSTGRYHMKMQTDSNLVCYPVGSGDTPSDAYWKSDTWSTDPQLRRTLHLNSSGSLYVDGKAGATVLARDSPVPATEAYYRATLDPDGVFRLYAHRVDGRGVWKTSRVWESVTDKCRVNGLCGLNSFCSRVVDGEADCLCPPGFDYVHRDKRSGGCANAFQEDGGCSSSFSMITMPDTEWAEMPYYIMPRVSADQCMAACQEDCLCDAALFKKGTCNKQTLPLKNGRRTENSTMFIKVGNSSSRGGGWGFPKGTGSRKKMVPLYLLILICAALAICSVALCSLSVFVLRRHRSLVHGHVSTVSEGETSSRAVDVESQSPRNFSYEEMEKATGGFKEEVGRGAFGTVYKGALGEKLVAVKRLEGRMVGDGEKEFQTEVRAIGRTHHRNLVKLRGYCNEGSHRLLVYEYMSHGSLADLLFRSAAKPRWEERVRIALDVARGLRYLHDECEARIIHCDIKPQNILMDGSGAARIADFGLAKLLLPEQSRSLTQIRGTRGYVAPEWYRSVPVTVRADVYSFGVLLLEVAFCRRGVDYEAAEGEAVLTDWAYNCYISGELPLVVEGEELEAGELERVVKVGLWCIQEEPGNRPTMKNVALMLEGNMEVPPPPLLSFST